MGAALGGGEMEETDRRPAAFQTLYTAGHRVELAATKLGPGLPGFQAYHTSVVVDDIEFAFSGDGICYGPGLMSHRMLPDEVKVTYMGLTSITGDSMRSTLKQFFDRGTYDLLRKNCNSFSDCSLYFLLDCRLDPGYRGLEQLGHMADKRGGIVQAITGGDYRPNVKANEFSVERCIRHVNKIKSGPLFVK
ncbi:unnamed protein product [Polarella glacialis]|uniref:PPPDE domain-containing protein n=1 Tax=Polarella glacialis TaxID=89957 RepID=A0A813FHF4_POLGL|nr:unnamed protein product [Polarella glacialis]